MEIFFSSFTLIKINITLAPTNPTDCKEMSRPAARWAEMLLHIWSVWSLTVPEKSPDGLQQACNTDSHALASLVVVVINLFLSFTLLLTVRYLSIVYFHLGLNCNSSVLTCSPSFNDTSFTLQRSLTKKCASLTDFSKHVTTLLQQWH